MNGGQTPFGHDATSTSCLARLCVQLEKVFLGGSRIACLLHGDSIGCKFITIDYSLNTHDPTILLLQAYSCMTQIELYDHC